MRLIVVMVFNGQMIPILDNIWLKDITIPSFIQTYFNQHHIIQSGLPFLYLSRKISFLHNSWTILLVAVLIPNCIT